MEMIFKHKTWILLIWFVIENVSIIRGQWFLRGFTQQQAEEFTKFYLYTNSNRDNGQLISASNLNESNLNPTHPVRFIIHGWLSSANATWIPPLKDEYLKRDNFNVIVVDWSEVSSAPYSTLTRYVRIIGYAITTFVRELSKQKAVPFDNVYLIGHSLGAHIAGFAGKQLHPDQINTIFALDAAGPRFEGLAASERVSQTDAKYVESIHTNTVGIISDFGYRPPIGQASFYPHYGNSQPGCVRPSCSHERATRYFTESINSDIGFWGRNCQNFQDIERERCNGSDPIALMGGEPSKNNRVGVFYVPVRSRSPFAFGPIF